MDALISGFVEDIKQRAALYSEDNDASMFNDNATDTDGKIYAMCIISLQIYFLSFNQLNINGKK